MPIRGQLSTNAPRTTFSAGPSSPTLPLTGPVTPAPPSISVASAGTTSTLPILAPAVQTPPNSKESTDVNDNFSSEYLLGSRQSREEEESYGEDFDAELEENSYTPSLLSDPHSSAAGAACSSLMPHHRRELRVAPPPVAALSLNAPPGSSGVTMEVASPSVASPGAAGGLLSVSNKLKLLKLRSDRYACLHFRPSCFSQQWLLNEVFFVFVQSVAATVLLTFGHRELALPATVRIHFVSTSFNQR